MEEHNPQYNSHFNGLTRREFLSNSTVRGFYEKDRELGERKNYSSGNLRVSLLDTCNENCFFCYNEGMVINNEHIKLDDLEVILNAIDPLINQIKLVGGEPLIHPQFHAMALISEKHKPTTITTNGLLMNVYSDVLMGMESVTVSIHSIDNEKYNNIVQRNGNLLNKVLENIRLLQDRGYESININAVLTKRNKEDINEVIDFGINHSIPKISIISLLTMNERDRENFVSPEFYEKKLDNKYPSEVATTSRKRYFVNDKTVIDSVWQYCIVGCDICRKDGFIRVTPDLKFSYCLLDGAGVSISEEVKNKDLKGIRSKFESAISLMGNPIPYNNEK